MANRFSPDCCCALTCSRQTFTASGLEGTSTTESLPFSTFAIAEGTDEVGSWPIRDFTSQFGLPGSVQTRRNLTDGQRLADPPPVLKKRTGAWWQMIDFDGDADVTWAGGTIAVRTSAGTVSAGGNTAAVMSDGAMGDDPVARTRLILHVTPDWYGVYVLRYHDPDYDPTVSPSGNVAVSRGSIQCIDRENDPSERSVEFRAVGSASVHLWWVADSTVVVKEGAVTQQCFRPEFPFGTEAGYQHQAGDTTLHVNLVNQTWTWPSTVVPTSGTYLKFRQRFLFDTFPAWRDGHLLTILPEQGGLLYPALNGRPPEIPGINSIEDDGQIGTFGISSSILQRGATAEMPYPKPMVRHRLAIAEPSVAFTAIVEDIEFGADGTAAATLSNSIPGASLSWSAL